jgi:hypothetical protein
MVDQFLVQAKLVKLISCNIAGHSKLIDYIAHGMVGLTDFVIFGLTTGWINRIIDLINLIRFNCQ